MGATHISENIFNSFLRNIREAIRVPGKPIVFVFSKGCYNHTQFRGFSIKFEGVELHRDVKNGDVFKAMPTVKDIFNFRKRIV